jgi:hypothetical protein
VHVWATAPDTAPASSFLTALGFLSPSGVRYVRTHSYVMKLSPTCKPKVLITRSCSQVALSCVRGWSYVWGHACNSRNDAAIQGRDPAFCFVHCCQGRPHARKLSWPCAKFRKRSGLDGEACPDDVQRIRKEHRCYSGQTATDKSSKGRHVAFRRRLEHSL